MYIHRHPQSQSNAICSSSTPQSLVVLVQYYTTYNVIILYLPVGTGYYDYPLALAAAASQPQ